MQSILKSFLLLFFFGCFAVGYSQLDKSNGTTVGVLNAPAKVKKVKTPKSLEFGNDTGFKTANKELEKKREKERKEKELLNKGIITPEMMAQRAFNKNAEKYSFEVPMIDMDLGSFHTTSNGMNFISYDFGINDGDVISVIINGETVRKNFELSKNLILIRIPLKLGINKIEIIAENEGKYRPNTGDFRIFDDYKQEVISDRWYLAKGAKVVAIVVRDEK